MYGSDSKNREIAESRKQKAESRKQKAEKHNSNRLDCQASIKNSNCQLRNGKNGSRNKQQAKRRFRCCCYVNYIKIFSVDVKIAKTIMARDYKGFGSGLMPSNGVIEIYEN